MLFAIVARILTNYGRKVNYVLRIVHWVVILTIALYINVSRVNKQNVKFAIPHQLNVWNALRDL